VGQRARDHPSRLCLESCRLRCEMFSSPSGAGTNLKVGAPVQSESGGTYFSAEKNIFWSCPSTVLALQVQLVILVIAFVMVSTVWSVSCLLFFYSRCPPCPAICKSGGTCPPVPHEVGATEKACTNYKAMEWCRVDLTVT